jgi:hypothetical protein
LFFSVLSISAYLLPLVVGVEGRKDVRLALVLEYGIPACKCKYGLKRDVEMGFLPKFVGPLAGTILPWALSARCEGNMRERFSHLCVLGK